MKSYTGWVFTSWNFLSPLFLPVFTGSHESELQLKFVRGYMLLHCWKYSHTTVWDSCLLWTTQLSGASAVKTSLLHSKCRQLWLSFRTETVIAITEKCWQSTNCTWKALEFKDNILINWCAPEIVTPLGPCNNAGDPRSILQDASWGLFKCKRWSNTNSHQWDTLHLLS